MDNLQKIVVLCLFALVVIGAFYAGSLHQPDKVIKDDYNPTQNDPPLVENDTYAPEEDEELIACTADAKLCYDGTAVGRVGPDCEFAACPEPAPGEIVCTEEQKNAQACTMEYSPVCGNVRVECITAPCDPVPQTFSNPCTACAQGNVISYTKGSCEV